MEPPKIFGKISLFWSLNPLFSGDFGVRIPLILNHQVMSEQSAGRCNFAKKKKHRRFWTEKNIQKKSHPPPTLTGAFWARPLRSLTVMLGVTVKLWCCPLAKVTWSCILTTAAKGRGKRKTDGGPLLGENVLESPGKLVILVICKGNKVSIQKKWALEIPVKHFWQEILISLKRWIGPL